MRTENGGPALFRLVRYWSRRWASGIPEAGHVGHILVLEAIDAAGRPAVIDAAGRPALIGAVAVELGLDRSNASRMLASAVAAGLVTRTVAPDDARRTEFAPTPAGSELLAAARAWQEQTFLRLVAGWPADDARRFASYLVRLAEQQKGSP